MSIATVASGAPCRFCQVRSGDLYIVDTTTGIQRWDGAASAAWQAGLTPPATGSLAVADGGAAQTGYGTNAGDYWCAVRFTDSTAPSFHFPNGVLSSLNVDSSGNMQLISVPNISAGRILTWSNIPVSTASPSARRGNRELWRTLALPSGTITITGGATINSNATNDTYTLTTTTNNQLAYQSSNLATTMYIWSDGSHYFVSPTLGSTGSHYFQSSTNQPTTGAWTGHGTTSGTLSTTYNGGTPATAVVTLFLVASLNDNSTTSYTDQITDLSLSSGGGPTANYYSAATQNGGLATLGTSAKAALVANSLYYSLPIYGADGSLNANRFVAPPQDGKWPYVCYQQDRMLLAGNTTASFRNTIKFSEPDEPESMPPGNILTVQDNTGDDDEVTGLIQHGMRAYLLKERHIYSIQWIRQPSIDGACFLVNDRGAISDRCCTWLDGLLYVMDGSGVYSFDGYKSVPVSEPIADLWRNGTIDFAQKTWFHASHDNVRRIVSFFVRFSGDGGTRPERALVYHPDTGVWDLDLYPWEVGGSCVYTISGQPNMILASTQGLLKTGVGLTDVGNTAIPWKHKTGMLEYPVSESRTKRQFRLSYSPTTAANTLTLQIFRGWDSSPANMDVYENLGIGITSTPGSPNITMDLSLNRSTLGKDPGFKQFQYRGSADDRSQDDRYVTWQMSGAQSSSQITILDYEIQGVFRDG